MKTISNQDSVSAFSLTLDNSAVASTTQYRLFDSDLVLSAINGSLSSATSTTIEKHFYPTISLCIGNHMDSSAIWE